MQNKIAVITTGGTVESILENEKRDTSKNNPEFNEKLNKYNNIDIFKVMNKLSENMMPQDWILITKRIKEKINQGYENIIVTHGTDTMVYTASAVKILLGNINETIIFTGAMDGPDSGNSDFNINISGAIEACKNKYLNGVFVSLRSNESINKVYMHDALYVKPPYMDSKGYESIFDNHIGTYKLKRGWNWNNVDDKLKNVSDSGLNKIPDLENIKQENNIQFLSIYPGINISNYIHSENIIISSYHSGTASSEYYENSLMNFIKNNKNKNIFLTGYSTSTITNMYQSTANLQKEGIILIKDIQPHVLYVSLYLGLTLDLEVLEILNQVWNIKLK